MKKDELGPASGASSPPAKRLFPLKKVKHGHSLCLAPRRSRQQDSLASLLEDVLQHVGHASATASVVRVFNRQAAANQIARQL